MAGRASKWNGAITVDGKKVNVFLDGKGSAFDQENNEYQWQADRWVLTRRPCMSISQFAKKITMQPEESKLAKALLETFGL